MKFLNYLSAISLAMTLAACGGGGGSSDSTPVITPGGVVVSPNESVAKIIVTPSSSTINADGVSLVKFKINAVNKSSALVPSAVIDLNATNGVILSSSSVVMDENGAGEISMVADAADQNGRISTLTASCVSCAAVSVSKQINVVGASVALLNPDGQALTVGGSKSTLSVTIKNALGVTMQDVAVSFAVTDSSIIKLSDSIVKTDSLGVASVTVSGLKKGTASVNVSALGNAKSQVFTVGNSESVLAVTSPVNSAIVQTNTGNVIVVSAPGAKTVIFTSVLGVFANNSNTQTINVVNGLASAVLTVSQAGVASVTVSDDLLRTISLKLIVSPPVSSANKIILNANQTTLPVATIGNQSSIQITARAIYTVGASDQSVANVPIDFSMTGGPGGGEFLTPALAYTDSSGTATATFYAGSSASIANGITIQADIPGTTIKTGSGSSSNNLQLTIGGKALSVAFGPASELQESSDKTLYIQAYSVQVTDANNNPVSDAIVTLRMQPVAFSTGSSCTITKTFCSEDVNGNGSLDQGEDSGRTLINKDLSNIDICSKARLPYLGAEDKLLTPQNSDGGSVPATVTTKDGIAAFSLTYLKGSAIWVVDKLTATVSSNGTESSKSTIFRLAPSEPDSKDACHLPDSPYLE